MGLNIKKPYFFRDTKLFLLIGFCLLVGCEKMPSATQQPKQLPTEFPRFSPTPSLTLAQTIIVVSATNTLTPVVVDFVPSFEASDFVGEVVTIKIEKAYCSYRPDVNGAPTFCNDQPFPNHSFTLISWGRDWTDLDGKCILIEGVVEVYNGKFEIVADSRDQIMVCD